MILKIRILPVRNKENVEEYQTNIQNRNRFGKSPPRSRLHWTEHNCGSLGGRGILWDFTCGGCVGDSDPLLRSQWRCHRSCQGEIPCAIHHQLLLYPGREENMFNSRSFLSLTVFLQYSFLTKPDIMPAVKGMPISTAKDRK